jgi:hypothetical protein
MTVYPKYQSQVIFGLWPKLTPTATVEASIQIRNPLLCAFEVSATQDGIVAVFIPFPTPVITWNYINNGFR